MTGTSDWISVELDIGGLRVSCQADLIVIHIGQTHSVHSSSLLFWKSRIYFSAVLGSAICFKVLLFLEISHILVHSLSVVYCKDSYKFL